MSNHGLTADNMMQQFPIALQKDPKTVALGQAIAKVMESRQDEIDSLRIYVGNVNAKFPVARHRAFRCGQDDGDVLQNAGHGILLPKGNGGQVVCRYQVVVHKNHLILSGIPIKKCLR